MPTPRKKKITRADVPLEDYEHAKVVEYLRDRGDLFFYHVPNGSKAAPQYRKKLKTLGVIPGIPDLVITKTVYLNQTETRKGLYLELKRTRFSTTSMAQKECMIRLEMDGFFCRVAKGHKEAIKVLESLYGPPPVVKDVED